MRLVDPELREFSHGGSCMVADTPRLYPPVNLPILTPFFFLAACALPAIII
ncbi:MAG: hypothetical protein LBE86_02105 [Gemmobacter sp.]|jgi:hypothetical protein|nr:hypothetical protein [Gemmobacter sp.]